MRITTKLVTAFIYFIVKCIILVAYWNIKQSVMTLEVLMCINGNIETSRLVLILSQVYHLAE